MQIIWHGHSCFELRSVAGTIVLDPYEPGTVPGFQMPLLEADAVFASHEHFDHNARSQVKLTGRKMNYEITEVHSFHDQTKGSERGTNRIRVFAAEGLKIAHFGDQGCALEEAQYEQLQDLDLVLIPIGGTYTLDAEAALAMVEKIKPKAVVPMHYREGERDFPVLGGLESFAEAFPKQKRLKTNVIELTSGVALEGLIVPAYRLEE